MLTDNLSLIKTLTFSQMKSRYRKTSLGLLWVLLNPILSFIVQALIFKNVLKVNIENYYLFLLVGIIPWIFITSNLTMNVGSIVASRQMLLSFKVKPWLFIFCTSIDNFINYLAAFFMLLILIDISALTYSWYVLPIVFLYSVLVFIFSFFLSFLFSVLNVFVRDLQFVLSFGINLLYFITPIFYPSNLIPEKYQFLIKLNPIYILIKPFQSLVFEKNITLFFNDAIFAVGVTVFILITTLLVWKKYKHDIYFNI